MKVRFQADADLNQIIVAASLRRAPEVDFRTASVTNACVWAGSAASGARDSATVRASW